MRHRRGRWLELAILVAIAGGCQSTVQSDPPGGPTDIPTSATPSSTVVPAPTGSRSDPSAASSGDGTSNPNGLVVDAGLLAMLPADVDGVAMDADPQTAATLVDDPQLSAAASSLAMARYIASDDPGGDDLAVVSIVQLRPGVFSEPFFATWRADYDGSACDAAGGATGTDEQTIGAHTVHVGTCDQGARTYHLHLDGDVIVSILAVGPRALGVGIIEGLRP